MESSGSLPIDSPKKMLRSSSSKSSPSDQSDKAHSDRSPWSSKTPEKPVNPRRRVQNRRAALSLKEVREAAAKLHKSDQGRCSQSDPVSPHELEIGSRLCGNPTSKPKLDRSTKLPEMFEILVKFFDSLDSSIRLLRLKGSVTTFNNISPKVEFLTDRRFSYSHLAQLKYILPEVFELKKLLIHDEQTSCMKPELHVTLKVDSITNEEKLKLASRSSYMRKSFRNRLLDFFKAHPQGEVPEETLPEPFNQSRQHAHVSTSKSSDSCLLGKTSTVALAQQQPAAAASHLSQSFRKRILLHNSRDKAVNGDQVKLLTSVQPSVLPDSEPRVDWSSSEHQTTGFAALSGKQVSCDEAADSYQEQVMMSLQSPILPPSELHAPSICKFSLRQTTSQKSSSVGASQISVPSSHPPATPIKEIQSVRNEMSSSLETSINQGTPAKFASTPTKLMSATPAQRPPKRCFMSPDDDSTSSPRKLVPRARRSISLKFDSPVENEASNLGRVSVDNDIFEILPENLLQSIRDKEMRALEEQDPVISQAKKRLQMIASLPKLFDMIHFLFQSIQRSVITKEELMHRIITSHLDIVDRREVEDQLELLRELLPEWIYEKSAYSGDLLICVNKISTPESLRARLDWWKQSEKLNT